LLNKGKRAIPNREIRDRFIAITNEGLVYQDIDISDNLRKYEISYQDIIWVDFVHEYESEDFYRVRYKSGEKVENLNIDFYFTDDHNWVEILREEIIRRNKIVSIRIEVMNVKDVNDFKRRIKNKMEELSIYGAIENTSERVAYIIAEGNEELLNRFIVWCKEQFGEESILISYERVSGFEAIEIR
jgi:acylphosphatase